MVLCLPLASPAVAAPAQGHAFAFQGENHGIEDVDARTGRDAPTTAPKQRVEDLRATARWNQSGTPHSLIRPGGFLARGLLSVGVVEGKIAFVSSSVAGGDQTVPAPTVTAQQAYVADDVLWRQSLVQFAADGQPALESVPG